MKMNFIPAGSPKYSLAGKLLGLSESLAALAAEAEDRWLQRTFSLYVHPAIVRAINSKKHLPLCASYLERHGFHITVVQFSGWRYVMRRKEYLGAFRWSFAESKVLVQAITFDAPLNELPESLSPKASTQRPFSYGY